MSTQRSGPRNQGNHIAYGRALQEPTLEMLYEQRRAAFALYDNALRGSNLRGMFRKKLGKIDKAIAARKAEIQARGKS